MSVVYFQIFTFVIVHFPNWNRYTTGPVRFFSVRNNSEFQQLSKKKHSGLKTTVIISHESGSYDGMAELC